MCSKDQDLRGKGGGGRREEGGHGRGGRSLVLTHGRHQPTPTPPSSYLLLPLPMMVGRCHITLRLIRIVWLCVGDVIV